MKRCKNQPTARLGQEQDRMGYLTARPLIMLKREREGVLYPCIISIREAIDLVACCEFIDSRERERDKTNEARKTRNKDTRWEDKQCSAVMVASCECGW